MFSKFIGGVSLFTYVMLSKNGQDSLEQILTPSITRSFKEFHFETGVTPLSHWGTCVCLCLAYLASVFLMKRYMEDHTAWNLSSFRVLHNGFLCAASIMMVLGIAFEVVRVHSVGGMEALVCDENRLQRETNIYFWFYVFFLSKFYEFLDTHILILRKKPISFLHCFHHFITIFVVWSALHSEDATQWVVIGLNGCVHVAMYYYFLAQTLGKDVWWKKYLTMIQIVQFIFDILVVTLSIALKVNNRNCSGHLSSLIFGNAILVSFLVLFLNFYNHSYQNPKKVE